MVKSLLWLNVGDNIGGVFNNPIGLKTVRPTVHEAKMVS